MSINKNKGILTEGCPVTICMADTSGSCVFSYKAIYRNGWFDHNNPSRNSRHDTLKDIDGCYAWYIVDPFNLDKNKEDFV